MVAKSVYLCFIYILIALELLWPANETFLSTQGAAQHVPADKFKIKSPVKKKDLSHVFRLLFIAVLKIAVYIVCAVILQSLVYPRSYETVHHDILTITSLMSILFPATKDFSCESSFLICLLSSTSFALFGFFSLAIRTEHLCYCFPLFARIRLFQLHHAILHLPNLCFPELHTNYSLLNILSMDIHIKWFLHLSLHHIPSPFVDCMSILVLYYYFFYKK